MSLSVFDVCVYAYFLSHIPATLLVDAQALFSPVGAWHPAFARDALRSYCAALADPLMCAAQPSPWFVAIIAIEVCAQLPFFVVVLRCWAARPRWLRLGLLVYGGHVATTLVPIYGELIGALRAGAITSAQAAALSAIYAPYLLMPLALLLGALREELMDAPGSAAAAAPVVRGRSASRGSVGARASSAGRTPAGVRASGASRTPSSKIKKH